MKNEIDYKLMWEFLKMHLQSLQRYYENHSPLVNSERIELIKIISEDMKAFEAIGSGQADELLYDAVNRKDE